jgi:plasmid stabilization system protein ParE
MRVSLSNEAQIDADATADWYIGEGAFRAADDFADALEQAFDLLSQFPEMGEPGSLNTRTLTLHSFPYSLSTGFKAK